MKEDMLYTIILNFFFQVLLLLINRQREHRAGVGGVWGGQRGGKTAWRRKQPN